MAQVCPTTAGISGAKTHASFVVLVVNKGDQLVHGMSLSRGTKYRLRRKLDQSLHWS